MEYKITVEEIKEGENETLSVAFESKDNMINVLKKLLTADNAQCNIHDLTQFAWP